MSTPTLTQAAVSPLHAAAPGVLQLLPDLSVNRIARHGIALSRSITQAGGVVIAASAGGRLEPQMHRAGAQLTSFARTRSGMFHARGNQDLLNDMHSHDIALVHTHGHEDGLAAKALADAANVPLIMTCHEIPAIEGFFARRTARKHLAGRPIIAVSDYLAGILRKTFDLDMRDVIHIPTGLDIDDFAEENVSSERAISLADRWGLVEDPRPIVLVPEASRSRNWLETLAAATERTEGVLWIVVDDDPEGGFEAPEALRYQVQSDKLRWIGRCDDIAAAMKLASVVAAIPDLPVASADTALEAQAMGRPVIVTDTGAGREALDHDRTGWLVPVGDADAMAAAVGNAIALDQSGRDHVGLAGRAFVRSRFDVGIQHKALLRLYDQVLGHV